MRPHSIIKSSHFSVFDEFESMQFSVHSGCNLCCEMCTLLTSFPHLKCVFVLQIRLERVRVKELPINVFPALNQLVIRHSEIGEVRQGAFRALVMTSVTLDNTTVQTVHTEAFTTRGSIGLLKLEAVRVGVLESNCLQAGIQQIVIRGSR